MVKRSKWKELRSGSRGGFKSDKYWKKDGKVISVAFAPGNMYSFTKYKKSNPYAGDTVKHFKSEKKALLAAKSYMKKH
jgi:hypothetical protein